MANPHIMKILELYKEGQIGAEEAEKMLAVDYAAVPWPDDGGLRIVAYVGRKLLQKGHPDTRNMDIHYDGAALNVECWGNLTCGNIAKNVSVGGSLTAGEIGGNVACGGSVKCHNLKGYYAAGGGVETDDK